MDLARNRRRRARSGKVTPGIARQAPSMTTFSDPLTAARPRLLFRIAPGLRPLLAYRFGEDFRRDALAGRCVLHPGKLLPPRRARRLSVQTDPHRFYERGRPQYFAGSDRENLRLPSRVRRNRAAVSRNPLEAAPSSLADAGRRSGIACYPA